jgi:methionyl-tRNA synthetase
MVIGLCCRPGCPRLSAAAVIASARAMEESAMTEQAETTTQGKPQISFDEFAKVDLRVAKVLEASDHPDADRLLVLKVDDGSGTPRQICAGIKGHYAASDMVGRSIVIVANLAPRKIRGQESNGMLLAGSDGAKGEAERRVVVLTPAGDLAPGSIVT